MHRRSRNGQFFRCQIDPMAVFPAPSHSSRAISPKLPVSPGLHSPVSCAGYPPASDLLEGGVGQLDAQGKQRGPHCHSQ